MRLRGGRLGLLALVLVLTACASDPDPAPASAASAVPSPVASFPVETFAALSEDPVSDELAAKLQAALALLDVTGGGGMSATVMTPAGTWRGTTGKADGVRDLRVDDQLAIASITKSVVAAQVMLMVEAGELELDDPASEHLPEDLDVDTNGATIRQLLSHRAGIPDYYDLLGASQEAEPKRVWTPAEILELLPTSRRPPGEGFLHTETNYLVLRLVIEHLRGRPLVEVLRGGALDVDGLERLVYQPDERPTEPIAMPAGASRDVLEPSGGFLPSLANVTAYHASGAIASDSLSIARWWRAFCAGEIVSPASVATMTALEPTDPIAGYGLGVANPGRLQAASFGHTGQLPGFMSWAACLPEDDAVIVVLTNHEVEDGHFAFSHGLAAPLIDALRAG